MAFDVSKVVTTIKAKNEKGVTETRLITSERDIEIQLEVGLANTTTGRLKFMENVFSATAPKIYSRMPDNMLDFLNKYFTKYNRYPNVNANINIYEEGTDSQGNATYTLTDSIQGPIVARYMASRKPMEQIEKMLMDAMMNAKEKQAQIPMTNQHYYVRDPDTTLRKDALISTTDVSVVIIPKEGEPIDINGALVVIKKKKDDSTEPVTKADSYDCTYPYKNESGEEIEGKYVWGILTQSQQTNSPQYKDWIQSTSFFGDFTFVMEEQKEGETTPQHLNRIEFSNLPEFKSVKMGLCLFTGHTEESVRYLYAIDGFLEEKYDREIEGNSENGDIEEIAKNLRFKFQLGVQKEEDPPVVTFNLESAMFTETDAYPTEGGGQRTTTVSNIRQTRANGLQETYMYLDPLLHLPEIHNPKEEIPFTLAPKK